MTQKNKAVKEVIAGIFFISSIGLILVTVGTVESIDSIDSVSVVFSDRSMIMALIMAFCGACLGAAALIIMNFKEIGVRLKDFQKNFLSWIRGLKIHT